MEPVHVVILDLGLQACSADHGAWLARLLRDSASPRAIDIQSFHRLPSATLTPPALILLRPASAGHLSELVPCLRGRWPRATLLGLFCPGEEPSAAGYHVWRSALDDFLTCPFRDMDVVLRMQPLLQGTPETVTTPQVAELRTQLCRAGLVGESGPFLRVVAHALRVAHSDATILLAGETGTGKELVSRTCGIT